jgi:flagellar motor switch protein FliM
MHITMPYSMIEPIRETLDAGMQSDVDDIDDRWLQSLREDILNAKVAVHGTVVEKELSLREVAELKEGDIIPVDMPEDFVLEAQGIPMFRGKVGVSDEHLAVKIIEQINHRRR